MKIPGHPTGKLNMIMSFWYVIILAMGVVRTQQVVTDLNLTPALLNNLNSNAVMTSDQALIPAATFSPYSPYIPPNSAADESDPPQGTVIGIIIGCAIVVIGGILLYRWISGQRGLSSENNRLINSFESIKNAALKSTDYIPSSSKMTMQGRPSSGPSGRSMDAKRTNDKQAGLLQPSLYADEHAILDSSMDLPILPSNLSASERVRIIIDTLRKNRDYQSRPCTPMNVEKSDPSLNGNRPVSPSKMYKQVSESGSQNVNIFPTSVPPPGVISSLNTTTKNAANVPLGYRPLKPLTRPNKNASNTKTSHVPETSPGTDQIDLKVSNMIQNVLNHTNNKK